MSNFKTAAVSKFGAVIYLHRAIWTASTQSNNLGTT